MLGPLFPRFGLLSLIALLLWVALANASWAQAPRDIPPEKAEQFLELLNDPEVKAWLEAKTSPVVSEPDRSIHATVSSWEAAIRARIGALANAVPRFPEELARAAGIVSRDVNSGRPGLVIGIMAVFVVIGFGAEWLVRRILGWTRNTTSAAVDDPVNLQEVSALLVFSLASTGSFLALDWPPLLRRIVFSLLMAVVAFRVVRLIARLLLSSRGKEDEPDQAEVPVSNGADFWLRRASVAGGFVLFGWAIVSLMPDLGFSVEVRRLVAFGFGLTVLATVIEAVWRQPGRAASPLRRLLLSLYLVGLWIAWMTGLLGLLWLGIYALLLPPVVRGVGDAAQILADRTQRADAFGVMLKVLIARGARALMIAAAVVWLEYVTGFAATAVSRGETGELIVNGLFNGIVILLVADLLWQLSKALIAYRLEVASQQGASADDAARHARILTLFPIFRNALGVFIAVVAVLTILSGFGVQIAPLIAGAGVFGVAVGFGSQTLVKDVLSGVFYMLDDAFRIGEYIQSGSYKGTVESFSLRSVRLRHHRGPVFTVPFSELGAVQNMSRDWVIDKMTIGVTHDSDVDLARKLVKKIGQELAANPEFAADTIQPLKMQGIDEFSDFAIILRMKLMTKPGTQFAIKRQALMMIKKAFAENGIKIAVPTVHVEGGGETPAAAYQAQQVLKMHQTAETAAGQS